MYNEAIGAFRLFFGEFSNKGTTCPPPRHACDEILSGFLLRAGSQPSPSRSVMILDWPGLNRSDRVQRRAERGPALARTAPTKMAESALASELPPKSSSQVRHPIRRDKKKCLPILNQKHGTVSQLFPMEWNPAQPLSHK